MIEPTFILNVRSGVVHKAYDDSYTDERCNVDDLTSKAESASIDELRERYGKLKFCRRCFRKSLEVPVASV